MPNLTTLLVNRAPFSVVIETSFRIEGILYRDNYEIDETTIIVGDFNYSLPLDLFQYDDDAEEWVYDDGNVHIELTPL